MGQPRPAGPAAASRRLERLKNEEGKVLDMKKENIIDVWLEDGRALTCSVRGYDSWQTLNAPVTHT